MPGLSTLDNYYSRSTAAVKAQIGVAEAEVKHGAVAMHLPWPWLQVGFLDSIDNETFVLLALVLALALVLRQRRQRNAARQVLHGGGQGGQQPAPVPPFPPAQPQDTSSSHAGTHVPGARASSSDTHAGQGGQETAGGTTPRPQQGESSSGPVQGGAGPHHPPPIPSSTCTPSSQAATAAAARAGGGPGAAPQGAGSASGVEHQARAGTAGESRQQVTGDS